MDFYGALKLDSNGRMDVSRYFESDTKVIFLYDSEKDVFEMRRVFGTESNEPIWMKVGEVIKVKKTGFIAVPEWVLELAPGKVEKMLVSPVYSEALKKISAVYMKPICEFKVTLPEKLLEGLLEGQDLAEKPAKKPTSEPTEMEPVLDLSERMLKSAFKDGFDTKVGREDTPLSLFTDDL